MKFTKHFNKKIFKVAAKNNITISRDLKMKICKKCMNDFVKGD